MGKEKDPSPTEKQGSSKQWRDYLPVSPRPPDPLLEFSNCSHGTPFRVAVVPDTHIPRHDKKAWATCLGVVSDFKPHAVVVMGDFGDFESISHHPKNRPDLTKFAVECYQTNLGLDSLQAAAGSAKIYFVEGNHEYRAVKYVNAFPHLDGLLNVPQNLYILPPRLPESFAAARGLKDGHHPRVNTNLRGITWIPFRNYLRRAWKAPWGCGYMHSAKANGSVGGGGRHHAAYHADNVGPVSNCKIVVYGHHHSFQFSRNAAGYEAWCAGFLGDYDADEPAFDYAGGPSNWVTGMLLQEFDGPLVSTEQVYIKKGRALFRGNRYG